jgi:hypothetical protein
MPDEKPPADDDRYHSRSVDAAAVHWAEKHPGEDPDPGTPSDIPEDDEVVPNRHSAAAEAASLRWREQHGDEE